MTKVTVPPAAFEGLCALRGNPSLDPRSDFIECLQYLSRYDSYRPAEQWIVHNPDEFWAGYESGFVEGSPNEATKTALA